MNPRFFYGVSLFVLFHALCLEPFDELLQILFFLIPPLPDLSVIAILNVREIVWLYASCLLFHGNTPVVPLRKELVVLSLL
jgi:hypothetical protein